MNIKHAMVATLLVLTTHMVNAEEEASCTNATASSAAQIEAIKEKYSKIAADQQQAIKAQAKSIMDESPDTTGPDSYVGADIELRDNIREFKLDLPNITMKSQRMAMDLPQVTMRLQAWSWDAPEIEIRQECHGGIDELKRESKTCHNDWPSFDYPCDEWRTVRGKDVCYGNPVAVNRRQEIELHVPEVTLARTDWVLDIPEITMKTETVKVNIPDIVVKNIEVVASTQKQESLELSNKAKSGSDAISKALNAEVSSVSKGLIVGAFACQRNQLREKIREAYTKIEGIESTIAASYNQAQNTHAADLVVSFETALSSIKSSKTKMLDAYKATRRDLLKKQQAALDSIRVHQEVVVN
ncbi:hypothetical protein [Pseudomonas sp. NFIX28]|uniref:hypothetical protein n=1 Tax=Pseudomonas sp. NFIX28 TaxID=1566235 RepID=UPI00089CA9CB|nr:hypothetical protein [Pseudomonas sp. NFIX28]SDZ44963.1 hypothetical protein SAMN03159453_03880 [Pseudomonas sp. NFIX28]